MSEQSIEILTLAKLEALITKIVQNVLQREITQYKDKATIEPAQQIYQPSTFLETFGTWEDTRTDEEIIDDIYTNRSFPREFI